MFFFNWIFFIMLGAALVIGQVAGFALSPIFPAAGKEDSGVSVVTMLIAATLIDICYRLNRGEAEEGSAGDGLIHPKCGGQFMFIPLWVLSGFGLIMLTYGWITS